MPEESELSSDPAILQPKAIEPTTLAPSLLTLSPEKLYCRSPKRWFKIQGLESRIRIADIYANQTHALIPFCIRNTSGHRLVIELSSSADKSIGFQLQNANWSALPVPVKEQYLRYWSPDTKQWPLPSTDDLDSAAGSDIPWEKSVTITCDPEAHRKFNEIFNLANRDSSVCIEKGETRQVIMVFRTDPGPKRPRKTPSHSRKPSSSNLYALATHVEDESDVPAAIQRHRRDSTNLPDNYLINDLSVTTVKLFFKATHEAGSCSTAYGSDKNIDTTLKNNGDHQSNHFSDPGSASLPSPPQAATFSNVDEAAETTDLCIVDAQFLSCQSQFQCDPASTVLLDECIIGKTYLRSISVRNISAIPLDWGISLLAQSKNSIADTLKLVNTKGVEIQSGKLQPFAQETYNLHFTPAVNGDYHGKLLFENLNDVSNSHSVAFRAHAKSLKKPAHVILLSENEINFGDNADGDWCQTKITFKNVSDQLVMMHFKTEGMEPSMEIKTKLYIDTGNAGTPTILEDGTPGEISGLDIDGDNSAFQSIDYTESGSIGQYTWDVDSTPRSYSEHPSATNSSYQTPKRLSTRETNSPEFEEQTETTSIPSSRSSRSWDKSVKMRETNPRHNSSTSSIHPSRPGPLDEVVIKPGATRSIIASVRRINDSPANNINSSQLTARPFMLVCEYMVLTQSQIQSRMFPKETECISIPCTIQTCTSLVRVEPSVLDFGSVDVGTLKSMYFTIENVSDIDAAIQCRVDSKVINCKKSLVTIPPQSSLSLRVDIYPRRTNSRYRKQINIINLKNRRNDQILDVKSEHIDRRRMTFHNLFYSTLVPENEQNFLDFGVVPLNSPILRIINVKNKCPSPITLKMSASDDKSIKLFQITPAASAVSPTPEIVAAAHKLSQMEKETEFHSNRDRFKEFASDRAAKDNILSEDKNGRMQGRDMTLPNNGHSSVTSLKPDSQTLSKVHPSPYLIKRLGKDMFIDKTVERSHACLIPFISGKKFNKRPSNIDYLDVASQNCSSGEGYNIVRIRRIKGSRNKSLSKQNDSALPNGQSGGMVKSPEAVAPGEAPNSMDKPSNAATLLPHSGYNGTINDLSDDSLTKTVSPMLEKQQQEERSPKTGEGQDGDIANKMGSSDLDAFTRAHDILSRVLKCLSISPPPSFPDAAAEDEFVRGQVDMRNYLDMLIRSGFLQPISTISLNGHETRPLLVLFRPSPDQFKTIHKVPRHHNESLYFNLVSFPDNFVVPKLPQDEVELIFKRRALPTRQFLIQASLCRSTFEIGQKNNNVGNMQTDEESQKYLLIKNRSEIPLLYAIKKTGYIASGDIRFEDYRYGVVRGYGSRKVVYYFKPSLPGYYNETISVLNVLDPEGSQQATLKATVRRPARFFIRSLKLDFGSFEDGKPTNKPEPLVISNMTNKARTLIINPCCSSEDALAISSTNIASGNNGTSDPTSPVISQTSETCEYFLEPTFPDNLEAEVCAPAFLDKETEEKIEALEQKLKIAKRKNRPEKIEKIQKKLAKLRGETKESTTGGDVDSNSSKAVDSTAESNGKLKEDKTQYHDSQTKSPQKPLETEEKLTNGDEITPANNNKKDADSKPSSPSSKTTKPNKSDAGNNNVARAPPAIQIKKNEQPNIIVLTLGPNATASIPVSVVLRRIDYKNVSQNGIRKKSSPSAAAATTIATTTMSNQDQTGIALGYLQVYEQKDTDGSKLVTLRAAIST
ncbi:hypothetical protein H4219_003064 [Mycoemilia scoparia]|uniref:HYDIN/VesB/CFA65-like Ig-like domain-containing protein n=1 Tax=Mycoemilia scoparia TaxID=417184 RepID=A0A9W7ZZS0_9FUNG|nr:hypothetical protein H4219_003064 [Mycoemilia scoparia]